MGCDCCISIHFVSFCSQQSNMFVIIILIDGSVKLGIELLSLHVIERGSRKVLHAYVACEKYCTLLLAIVF